MMGLIANKWTAWAGMFLLLAVVTGLVGAGQAQAQSLNAITGLTVTAADSRLILSWDAITNTAGIDRIIYRAPQGDTNSGSTHTLTSTPTDTTGTITGLNNGTTYYVEVRVVANNGNVSPWSGRVPGTPIAAPAISNVQLTPSASQIAFTWSLSRTDGVTVQRKRATTEAGLASALWLDVGPAATSFTDTGVTAGQDYYYQFRAFTAQDTSPETKVYSGTPANVSQQRISFTPFGAGSAYVRYGTIPGETADARATMTPSSFTYAGSTYSIEFIGTLKVSPHTLRLEMTGPALTAGTLHFYTDNPTADDYHRVDFASATRSARSGGGFMYTWNVDGRWVGNTPHTLDFRLPAFSTAVTASATTVTGNQAINLTSATTGGTVSTYAWTQTGTAGTFSATNVANPTWTAPAPAATERTSTLTLTVTNSSGGTATASVTITISADQAPSVTVASDRTTLTRANPSAALTATGTDPEGQTLTYAWSQTAGTTGTFSSTTVANPTWTAPTVSAQETATLQVVVTDPVGLTGTNTINLTNNVLSLSVSAAASATTVTGGQAVTLTATPSDSAAAIAWTQTGASGTFSATTGTSVTWTAPALTNAAQSTTITATATEGTITATDTVTITTSANTAPSATAVASNSSPREGTTITLTGTATDPENQTLTYAWTQTGAGGTGTFSAANVLSPTWEAPAVDTNQAATLTLTVTDTLGLTDTASVTITVIANLAPAVQVGADSTLVMGNTAVTLTGTATDANGDALTYAWTQTGVDGTFSDTAILSPTWTSPLATTAPQSTTLTLTATDPYGATGEASLTITTQGDAGPSVTATANPTTVAGGGVVTLTGTGSHPANDTLTYAWTQTGTGQGTFSATNLASTTWTAPAPSPTERSAVLTLTVTDTSNDTAEASVTITVSANRAPTLTLNTQPQTVGTGGLLNLSITTSDPDNDSLTYSWTQTGTHGTFSATNIPNPTWTAPTLTSNVAVTSTLTISVSDGVNTAVTRSVVITTEPNQAPELTLTTVSQTVSGGESVSLVASATDPEGRALTYLWTEDGASGTFGDTTSASTTWTAPATTNEEQTTTLTLTVRDADGLEAQESIVITTRANQAPTVTMNTAAQTVNSGQTVTLSLTATDPEGQALTYSWAQTGAAGTGTFSATSVADPLWTAPFLTGQETATLTVTVSDSLNLETTASVIITVRANQAPTVTVTTASQTVASGAALVLNATAADPEGQVITAAWTQTGLAGEFANASDLNTTWTAPFVNADTAGTLTLTVSDPQGQSTTRTVSITVSANAPPAVTITTQSQTVAGGAAVSIAGSATDPEGQAVTYQWTSSAGGTFANAASASTTWTAPPSDAAAQAIVLTLTATDPHDNEGTATITITVEAAQAEITAIDVEGYGTTALLINVSVMHPGSATGQLHLRYKVFSASQWVEATPQTPAPTVTFTLTNLVADTVYDVQASLNADYSSAFTTQLATASAATIGPIQFLEGTGTAVTVRANVNNLLGSQRVVYFSYRPSGTSDWRPTLSATATDYYTDFQVTGLEEDQEYVFRTSLGPDFASGATAAATFTPTTEPHALAPSREFKPSDIVCAVGNIPNCPAIYIFVNPILMLIMLFWMGGFDGLRFCRNPILMFFSGVVAMAGTSIAINPNPVMITITVLAALAVAGSTLRLSRQI